MHVYDGVEQQKNETKTKKRAWFMLNYILLILNRMVEHNAVIYVYCDFNLKLLHRPTQDFM